MARFNVSQADNYGGQGGGGYFSLKEDKQTADVRFLYDSVDDIEGFAVHEIPDKSNPNNQYARKSVNCLRDYGAPIDDCPFCKAGMPVKVKYFVPLYNIKENRVQTWERGKKFGGKLSSMCGRYPHLFKHTFAIERNGAPKSTDTQYEIWETGYTEDVNLEDFGEIQAALGNHVLDKTKEEMQYYIDRKMFPDEAEGSTPNIDDQIVRRTPANTSKREVF